MKKIGLIINPHAKKARLRPALIQKLVASFPHSRHVWIPETFADLSDATRKILDGQFDVVFLFGGDGTLRATLDAFLKHHSDKKLPYFVLLQGGTGNLYSRNYHGSRNPVTHMNAALEYLKTRSPYEVLPINILEVNDHFGFVFAMGGFSKIIHYYMSHKERSIALANWILFKTTISFLLGTSLYRSFFSPFSLTIKNGETTETVTATTFSCSTLPIGYILKPFHDIRPNETFGGIVINRSPYRLFLHLRSLFKNKAVVTKDIRQFSSSSIELLFSEPLQPMIDGDMLEPTTKVIVKLGPQINLINI